MGKVARNFSTSVNYAASDLCLKDGKLYEFTASHSAGAWDDADVTPVDRNVLDTINHIFQAVATANAAAAFSDSLVFESYPIRGTIYGFRFNNAIQN